MKKTTLTFKLGALLSGLLSLSQLVYSQTTTIINYQTWTGAGGCNIFGSSTNVPVTVNGTNSTMAHFTTKGQPTYDNTNNSVNLSAKTVNVQTAGTEYQMTVHFKKYYSYKITINAEVFYSYNGGTPAIFYFNLNNGGNGSNSLCNGPNIFALPSGGLVRQVPVNGSSFTDYNLDYNLLSSSEDYLIVGAIATPAAVDETFRIRKITIVETPPPPTFTLPSTVTIPCGSTDPQTFTVTNQYSSPGVTGYTWNLGASNGWLYNGSPAPATISTAANTLTLTPVCGITPNDISATVAIGSSDYNTNTLKPTITTPSLVMNGSDNICSGSQTYTATGVPCGAVVTWSVSPSGIVNIAPNGNQVTLTKINDGSVTLTASLSAPCTASVSKSISAGILMSGNVNNGGRNTPLYTVNFVAAGSTLVSFSWSGVNSINCVQSSTNPPISRTGFIYYPSSSSFWFTLAKGETIDVQFTVTLRANAYCRGIEGPLFLLT